MVTFESSLHFKDIFLKRSSLAARRDFGVRCDFNFSATQTRRRRRITRSAEQQIRRFYVFICKSALVSVESRLSFSDPARFRSYWLLLVSAPIDIFFLCQNRLIKLNSQSTANFRVLMTVRIDVDHRVRRLVILLKFYFVKTWLRKMTLQPREINLYNGEIKELISSILNSHFTKLKLMYHYKAFPNFFSRNNEFFMAWKINASIYHIYKIPY